MNKTDKPTASANVRVWGLHSTKYPQLPIERKCVAIGWDSLGDLSKLPRDREAFKRKYAEVYKDRKPSAGHVANNATQLLSFVWEAKVGDLVAYPEEQTVHIGRIVGDYRHHGDWTESYRNTRAVEWIVETTRQSLSKGAQNALKNLGTFFAIGENAPPSRTSFLVAQGSRLSRPPRSLARRASTKASTRNCRATTSSVSSPTCSVFTATMSR